MKKTVRTFTAEHFAKIVEIVKKRMAEEAPAAKIASEVQHKVGDIPRWSLPPFYTCGANCKFCKEHCYAVKDWVGNRVTSVSKHQVRNLLAVMRELVKTQLYLVKWIRRRKPAFFRIHPSGDFAVPGMGTRYAWMWYNVAKLCPDTRFLAFTKCYDIVREVPFYELPNFSLVLSEWTDVLSAPEDLKKYYRTSRAVEDLKDVRPDEMVCPGSCENCGMCWALKDLGKDVAFEIH